MYVFNKTQPQNRGFTLIELTVAIVILGLTVFGSAELFTKSLRVQRHALVETQAAYLAQEQVETLRAGDYEVITTGTFEARHTVFAPFERQTEVSLIDPDTLEPTIDDKGLKRIAITIFYPTGPSERSFVLSTFIAKQ